MVFVDRKAKYPNRWTLKHSDGSSEIVTLIRNDEPEVEGTPINAATLNELSTVAGALNAKEAAAESAAAARDSQISAANSASAAAVSESNVTSAAARAETAAALSENSAIFVSDSAAAADRSQKAAAQNQADAEAARDAAAGSARAAGTSEANAGQSAKKAAASEDNAKESEIKSKASEDAAKQSETNSATSEKNASNHERAAKTYSEKARDAINEAKREYSGVYYKRIELTAAQSGWKVLEPAVGTFAWYNDIACEDVTEAYNPLCSTNVESYGVASAAGVANLVETRDGYLRLFASKVPTADIGLELTLFGKGLPGYDLVIQASDWQELDEPIGPNGWYCDVAVEGCTPSMIPLGMTDLRGFEAAGPAGMAALTESRADAVRFFAIRQPTENINVKLTLMTKD